MLICFANTKGGSGKTTLAVHLAVWLFDQGHRVALLDVDHQHQSSHWVRQTEPGITVTTANNPKQVMQQIKKLRVDHDYIIGDGPGGSDAVSVALLLQADLALFPIMASTLDLWSAVAKASKLIAEIQKNRTRKLDVRLIVNGVDGRTRISKQINEAMKQLPIQATKNRIRRLSAFTTVPSDCTTVNRLGWKANAANKDTTALFRELMKTAASKPTRTKMTTTKKAANE